MAEAEADKAEGIHVIRDATWFAYSARVDDPAPLTRRQSLMLMLFGTASDYERRNVSLIQPLTHPSQTDRSRSLTPILLRPSIDSAIIPLHTLC
jgi:hypothetical protein